MQHITIEFEVDTEDRGEAVTFGFRIIERAIQDTYTGALDGRIISPQPTRIQLQDELAQRSAIIMRD